MKQGFQVIGGIILFIAVVFGLVFLSNAVGLTNYQFFAPKYEAARRKVYENTPSYIEGKIDGLNSYRLQYKQAKTAADSTAIREVIIQDMSDFDLSLLPPDLHDFYEEIYNK
jgi:hypothetical protein